MDRNFTTGLLAAAAVFALQACERPTTGTFATTARGTEPVTAAVPAAEAPAAEPPAPVAEAPAKALPSPESLSDTVITGRVKAGLLTDPSLAGADVSVNTDHGVVNLSGSVRNYEQLALASAHAQREDGVMRIENHLAVLNP